MAREDSSQQPANKSAMPASVDVPPAERVAVKSFNPFNREDHSISQPI